MLVKTWMSTPVITVNVSDSMQDAIKLLKRYHIKILPVLENGDLTGIITDRDLKKASASDATSLDIREIIYLIAKIKVKDIMTKNPITVPPYFTVEETARILLKNKILLRHQSINQLETMTARSNLAKRRKRHCQATNA